MNKKARHGWAAAIGLLTIAVGWIGVEREFGASASLQRAAGNRPGDLQAALYKVGRDASGAELLRFAESLGAEDVAGIFRDPARLFAGKMPGRLRDALLTRWARTARAAAVEYVQASQRPADIVSVFETWRRADEKAAVAWMRTFPSSVVLEVLSTIVDPAWDGARQADDAESGLWAGMGAEMLAQGTDGDVSSWIEHAAASRLKTRILLVFCQAQPERARAFLLAEGGARAVMTENQQVLNAVLGEWAEHYPLEAAQWIESMADSPAKASAWSSVIARWAESMPAQAADIANQMAPGPVQRESMVAAIAGWARRNPVMASRWVGRMSEGLLRCDAVEQVVFAWSRRDIDAAWTWARSLQPGPSRQVAFRDLKAMQRRGR